MRSERREGRDPFSEGGGSEADTWIRKVPSTMPRGHGRIGSRREEKS